MLNGVVLTGYKADFKDLSKDIGNRNKIYSPRYNNFKSTSSSRQNLNYTTCMMRRYSIKLTHEYYSKEGTVEFNHF